MFKLGAWRAQKGPSFVSDIDPAAAAAENLGSS